jgi:hypothetical protein
MIYHFSNNMHGLARSGTVTIESFVGPWTNDGQMMAKHFFV